MDETKLKTLIEQFFDATLTYEEENRLCRYLREHDVPAELRKDKETILALCSENDEIELPDSAEQRLEAMLDKLAEKSNEVIENKKSITREKRSTIGIPIRIWRGIVAAVVLTTGYLFTAEYMQQPANTENENGFLVYNNEKDTFDDPEEAMECFKDALDNMMLAMNTIHDNTCKIENTLLEAVTPYKKIVRIKTQ